MSQTPVHPDQVADGQPLRDLRVLVTGAAGLVGRRLVADLLALGCRVRGVDRSPADGAAGTRLEFVRGDLRDSLVATRACRGADAVVHCAAVQYHDRVPAWSREAYFHQNVVAGGALAAAAEAAGVQRIVYVSSDMAYGVPAASPVLETQACRPAGPYGRSKLECERIFCAARGRGARVAILRPRLIIGPGRLGVLRPLFDRVRAGHAIPLIGAGRNRYQMVAVADVSAACILSLRRGADGLFNLGSSEPPTVRELLTELCARAESRSRLVPLPAALVRAVLRGLDLIALAPLAPEQYRLAAVDCVLDTSAARRVLGWQARHTDIDMLWQAYLAYTRGAAQPSPVRAQRVTSAADVEMPPPAARPPVDAARCE